MTQPVDEVVAVWQEMSRHFQTLSMHMVQNNASQHATERAARQSTTAVRLATCGFVIVMGVSSFVIGTMVQASIQSAHAQRTGLQFELEAVEAKLDHLAALECRRALAEPTKPPPVVTAPR